MVKLLNNFNWQKNNYKLSSKAFNKEEQVYKNNYGEFSVSASSGVRAHVGGAHGGSSVRQVD